MKDKSIKRKAIILKKMKEIEESIEKIEENFPNNFSEFQSNDTLRDASYKRAEFIIQNIVDICAIINSDLDAGIPETEDDYIKNLGKENLLSEEWVKKIKEMKSFRNILVHRYGSIDDEIAFENISNWTDDFNEFIKRIEEILKKFERKENGS